MKDGEVKKEAALEGRLSWIDGFFWGVVASVAFALAVNLIVMRWHP